MPNNTIADHDEFSKEAIIADLKRVATSLKSKRLTISMYNEHGAYAPNTVANHFGTWNKAIELAGLQPTMRVGAIGNKRQLRRQQLKGE